MSLAVSMDAPEWALFNALGACENLRMEFGRPSDRPSWWSDLPSLPQPDPAETQKTPAFDLDDLRITAPSYRRRHTEPGTTEAETPRDMADETPEDRAESEASSGGGEAVASATETPPGDAAETRVDAPVETDAETETDRAEAEVRGESRHSPEVSDRSAEAIERAVEAPPDIPAEIDAVVSEVTETRAAAGETPQSDLRRLALDLGKSAFEAGLWHGVASAADALAPGAGRVVQGIRLLAGAIDALLSFQADEGFDLKLPMVDFAAGYSLDLKAHVLDPRQRSVPDLGIGIGWNTLGVHLEGDGDGVRAAVILVSPSGDRSREAGDGRDIEILMQRVLEYAHATQRPVSQAAPFAIVLIDHQANAGWLGVKPAGTDRPHVAFGFTIPRVPFSCPSCGHRTLSSLENEQCDECDWIGPTEARRRYQQRGGRIG